MSQSIRIRTTPLGTDNYLKLKLEQDFDFIEILSLKISQDKAYQNFCSDYGVIVGRVTINNGFGIPNAKVSVFIPIDDIDKEDPKISGIYPYETVTSKDSDGIRYNLLPKESDSQDDCYTPVGTFPAKREVLDNEDVSYVFCKYYKYTTVTNSAGDFMIFGVPLGAYTVHVDADISNIGIASQRPYDFIEQGIPNKSFYSPTKFKESKNLNTLIQVKTANVGVNVQPFWGNTEECEIGINRIDIDLNFNITPSSFFLGSYFGDSRKNSYNKNCRPRKLMGALCNQVTGEGTIEMLRKTKENQIERFDIEGGRLIDDKGTWAYMIPCNLDYVVTDEFGNLVPSEDESKGIPTRSRARFRISMDETGGLGRLRTRGKYLIPHNPQQVSDVDFTFDKSTKDAHFRDFYWNKIYTVKNFIARTEKSAASSRTKNYSGIKDVDGCVGDKQPMPYNRTYTKSSIIFTIICLIIRLIGEIVRIVNEFLCWLRGIGISTRLLTWKPFGGVQPIRLPCPTDPERQFAPGCGDTVEAFTDCVAAVLAESLNMFTFDFYNDWVNGTLYYYLLKYKKKRRNKREKFCEYYCKEYPNKEATGTNNCYNNSFADSTYNEERETTTKGIRNGTLVRYEGNLYYPPIALDGSNYRMFPTDIVNLGSIFDCDWQGFPKIIQYLPSSSFKIPPLTEEQDTDNNENVAGMIRLGNQFVGLFYNINCKGLQLNPGFARNIRRLAELQVDIPDGIGTRPPDYVSIRDIYDPSDAVDSVTSINRYLRDSFTLLNIAGSSTPNFPPAGFPTLSQLTTIGNGTSFNINQAFNSSSNGSTYTQFRGGNNALALNGDSFFQMWGNSYFVYFGIIPGASALDKFKAKYLTPCEKFNAGDFIIDTTIDCTSTNSAKDGKITVSFLGGTTPYIYTVTDNATVNLGPLTSTTGNAVVDSLGQGTYTITATDALGRTNLKDVEMCGPLGLTCNIYSSKDNTCKDTPDGEIEYSIVGGKTPYTITYTKPGGQVVNVGSSSSGKIGQLDGGSYTFNVKDANNVTCTQQVTVNEPPPLTVDIGTAFVITIGGTAPRVGYTHVSCGGTNDGGLLISVSGGAPPYSIRLTRPANVLASSDYDSGASEALGYRDLFPGNYTLTVKDSSNCSTVTKTFQILRYIRPQITLTGTNNKKQCDTNKYTLQFNVFRGQSTTPFDLVAGPPYTLFTGIDGVDYGEQQLTSEGLQTITIIPEISSQITFGVRDTNRCYNEITIQEPAIHRPNIKLTLTGNRVVSQMPNPGTPPPTTVPKPYGVITWTATYDNYSSFVPIRYSPINIIPPLMDFNNTYSATTWGTVLGTVTNNVGCTDTFLVPQYNP